MGQKASLYSKIQRRLRKRLENCFHQLTPLLSTNMKSFGKD